MKTFCFATMIGVLLLICAKGVQAQPTQTQLNQIELMKRVSEKTQLMPIKACKTLKILTDF